MSILLSAGTVSNTAGRLSSPPSWPPEQPQGLSLPKVLPVKNTFRESVAAGGFRLAAVLSDGSGAHEISPVKSVTTDIQTIILLEYLIAYLYLIVVLGLFFL